MNKKKMFLAIVPMILIAGCSSVEKENKEVTSAEKESKEIEGKILKNQLVSVEEKYVTNFGDVSYIAKIKNPTDKRLKIDDIKYDLVDGDGNLISETNYIQLQKNILEPNEEMYLTASFNTENDITGTEFSFVLKTKTKETTEKNYELPKTEFNIVYEKTFEGTDKLGQIITLQGTVDTRETRGGKFIAFALVYDKDNNLLDVFSEEYKDSATEKFNIEFYGNTNLNYSKDDIGKVDVTINRLKVGKFKKEEDSAEYTIDKKVEFMQDGSELYVYTTYKNNSDKVLYYAPSLHGFKYEGNDIDSWSGGLSYVLPKETGYYAEILPIGEGPESYAEFKDYTVENKASLPLNFETSKIEVIDNKMLMNAGALVIEEKNIEYETVEFENFKIMNGEAEGLYLSGELKQKLGDNEYINGTVAMFDKDGNILDVSFVNSQYNYDTEKYELYGSINHADATIYDKVKSFKSSLYVVKEE